MDGYSFEVVGAGSADVECISSVAYLGIKLRTRENFYENFNFGTELNSEVPPNKSSSSDKGALIGGIIGGVVGVSNFCV